MMVIKFSIYNQRLRRITSGIIPSGVYGKLKLEFDFRTSDWNAAEIKTANFYYNGENYPVHLDKNNQCFVPKDFIRFPSFSVSVHGGDIITNYVKISVENMKTDISVIPPTDNTTIPGGVFVPHIDEDKILSWTLEQDIADIEEIPPVDLNPFDEWSADGDMVSEYEWEEE